MPIRPQTLDALRRAYPDAGDPMGSGPVGIAAKVLGKKTLERLDKKEKEPLSGDWVATADALYLIFDGIDEPVRWRRKDIAAVTKAGGLLTSKIDVRLANGRIFRLNVGRSAVGVITALAER